MAADGSGLSLREEVQELRKRGESLGMNEEQIDDVILSVLGEKKNSPLYKQLKKNHRRGSWLRKLVSLTIFSAVLLLGVVVACKYNERCTRYLAQTAANLSYPFVRIVRFLVIPIHKFHDISFMNKWECLVDNPFFSQVKPDCAICEDVVKCPIHPAINLTKRWFKKQYYDSGSPVVIRKVPGYFDENHNFEELQELYQDNGDDLGQDMCEFYTARGQNDSEFKSLQELMTNWDHYKANGKMTGWKLCYGKGMRAIRELYQRPYFIHSEGALEKSVFLLQPTGQADEAQVVDMPQAFFENVWLAQVVGSSQVDLNPVDDCIDTCKSFKRTLIKGDILFFTQHMWTVSFKNIGSEPAILFSSSCA